jgi:D-glycerate 3-kinase
MLARSRAGGRVPVVAVAGPQGSGKTTLVQAAAANSGGATTFSLDDVYLPGSARRDIAGRIHPLFATRGVPGTHDLNVFNETLDLLLDPGAATTRLPSFDKVADEPRDLAAWPTCTGSPSLILVDGWCLGATAQPDEELIEPVNALEAQEDRLGRWRAYANHCLEDTYARAFARFDAILYLRAPSFEVIEGWRRQQEEGLLGRPLNDDDRARISRFVAHFERITRHMLGGGHTADVVVQLDEGRGVVEVSRSPRGRGTP